MEHTSTIPGVANLCLASRMRLLSWFHAALALILKSVSYICLADLSSIRYINMRGKYGGGSKISPLV